MLLVNTKIGKSEIAGTGLFADELIRQGTLIWRFKKGFDLRVDEQYPERLPEPAKSYFMKYAYQNPKTLNYVLSADDAKYFNHSENPNTACVKDTEDEDSMNIAARDIQPGEELTVDYREFDTHPFYGFENKNATN